MPSSLGRRARVAIEPLEDRTAPAFVTGPTFPVGPDGGSRSHPAAVVSADFNRDGNLDVATANRDADGVSVLLGTGTGSFKPAKNFAVREGPVHVVAADVNRDGRLDLVTANKDNNSVSVLLGTGTGSFTAAGHFAVGEQPVSVAVGDVNGDGRPDLAVANFVGGSVSLLFGSGTGTFKAAGTLSVGAQLTSVVIADFNGDGKKDLATAVGSTDKVAVHLNAGRGKFGAPVYHSAAFSMGMMAVADFDKDGDPDLAVTCQFPSREGIVILLGQGDGTFVKTGPFDAGNLPTHALAVGDLNGDGYPDVVTANEEFAANSVSVLLGDGLGGLGPARVFMSGQEPLGVAVGDFNRDGTTDVVTCDVGNEVVTFGGRLGTVSLLLGNGDGTLVAPKALTVEGPGPVVSADFNLDGKPDLAVIQDTVFYAVVSVFLGEGNGAFGPERNSLNLGSAEALAVGDFNADGKPDLAVVGDNRANVLLGKGDGTFQSPFFFTTGPGAAWVAVADFNNDTKADLAVADGSASGLSLLLGKGDGTFGPASPVAVGGKAQFVAATDLSGDGKADLAVVSLNVNQFCIVLGNGDGTFGAPSSLPTRVGPHALGFGQLDKNPGPDLVVPTFFGPLGGGSAVMVHVQVGAGQFSPASEYRTDSRPLGVAVGDFNGDGWDDFAVVNNFDATVTVYHAAGDVAGTFRPPARYVVGSRPEWAAIADFNGDGRPDLAVTNSIGSSVTLLQTPAPATHFRVKVLQSSVTAGGTVQVVVTAMTADGNIATNFTGTVAFGSTDPKATLPAAYQFTEADRGVRRFNVTLRTSGPQTITINGTAGTGSTDVTVAAGAARKLRLVAAGPATAGMPFDVTISALDAFGNVADGYRGKVRLTTNDRGAGVALPADYTFTPADAGTRTFSGVTLVTAGVRTLSAKALGTLWPLATGSVTVLAGAAAQVGVSAPTTTAAGLPVSVTVTVRDAFGNVAAGFTGTVHFTSSDPIAELPPDYTFTAADQGARTFPVVLKTAGTQSITVVSPTMSDGTQGGIVVKPGAATQTEFTQPIADGFIATPLKPPVTVLVRDVFGNPVAAGVRTTLRLVNNPSGAVLSGAGVYTAAGGVATFKAFAVNKPGQGYTLEARAGSGVSAPSSAFTVYQTVRLAMTVSAGTQVEAGTAFDVTVTALNSLNQPDATYAGTVRFTSTATPLADLPADYTFQPSDNGVHTFTVTLRKTGLQTLTVADLVKPTVKAVTSLTVTPAALSRFLISGLPLTVTANVARTFTVTAQDQYGNTITGYRGAVLFTNAGGSALLPTPYTFTALDKGRHVFKVTFQTPGAGQSLTVTDQADGAIFGTVAGITVA